MAIRRILTDDDPVLRKVSKPVTIFDDNFRTLIKDMDETLIKAEGAGISAVQVGVLKRAFIVAVKKEKYVVVNPEIISQSGTNKSLMEGCLSIPNKCGLVERPNEVEASFQDEFGNYVTHKFVGYIAKAFCHEYDHLDGILYTDKATKMFKSYEDYYKWRDKQKKKENTGKN